MNNKFNNNFNKNLNFNRSLKGCSSFKKNTDQRYKKVIDRVRNMNSIVIHDISISGEGLYGVYSIYSELTFLRLCIENDLYHPHLYRWSIGVSVGSIVITFILHIRYLYECYSKELALDYLNAIFDFIDFDNIRSLFYNIGKGKSLGDFAPMLILRNLLQDGAICSREALIELLEGNSKKVKFDNSKQYFVSKEYYKWLNSNNNLNNIFFICYAQSQTKMVAFTGNNKRFLDGTNYIEYEKLTPDNYIQAILCSSALTILYPQPLINRDKAIDGAYAEVNQFVHLQILINVSFLFDYNLLFTPMFLFFGITPEKNNNFLILVNKRNTQYTYEDLIEFKQYSNPLVNSIATTSTIFSRINYNSRTNVPLTALFLGQPYVEEFSINDITKNIISALKIKSNIIKKNISLVRKANTEKRVPVFFLTEEQFNSENDIFCVKKYFKTYSDYLNVYRNYNVVTSNIMTSTLVYGYSQNQNTTLLDKNYKQQLDANGNPINITINICNLEQFVRNSYRNDENIFLDYLFKKDTKLTDSLIGTGYISGSSIFDIHLRQSLYSESIKYVTCECLKPFISEIGPVVKKAVNNFLGPNQS
jgi:hypothetical protein